MPSIITAPVRTRNDSRSVSDAEMTEYVEAMYSAMEIGADQIVVVDNSETDNYEKTYTHGERIRQAIYKRDGSTRKIKVVSPKKENGMFFCAMSWKDQ